MWHSGNCLKQCFNIGLNRIAGHCSNRCVFRQWLKHIRVFVALWELFKQLLTHQFKRTCDAWRIQNCLSTCLNTGLDTLGMCGTPAVGKCVETCTPFLTCVNRGLNISNATGVFEQLNKHPPTGYACLKLIEAVQQFLPTRV